MPALFCSLLEVFWSAAGHDLHLGGVRLDLHDGTPLQVHAAFGAFLGDEEACHFAMGSKGHAGLLPCMLCRNVFNNNTPRVMGRGMIPHDSDDWNAIDLHTLDSLIAMADRLAHLAAHAPRAALNAACTEAGWNYTPHSVLFQSRWRARACPADRVYYDWMHIYCVNGVLNRHFGYLAHAVKPLGVSATMMHQYAVSFVMPGDMPSGADALTPVRFKNTWDSWTLKASASESLSLVMVLGMYFRPISENAAKPELRRHAACFMLLVHVIEMLLASARPNTYTYIKDACPAATTCYHIYSAAALCNQGVFAYCASLGPMSARSVPWRMQHAAPHP